MKSQEDIHMAHEMLAHLVRKIKPYAHVDATTVLVAMHFKDALCWVLEDDNAEALQGFLDYIDRIATRAGLHLVKGDLEQLPPANPPVR